MNDLYHINLQEKKLRDFFSLMIAKFCKQQKEKNQIPPGLTGYEFALRRNEIQLEQLKEENKRIKIMYSLQLLLEEHGWKEWDVSDEVMIPVKDGNYYSFIGTEDEYNNFINNLKEHE